MIYVIRAPVQEPCKHPRWARIAVYSGSLLVVASLIGSLIGALGSPFARVGAHLLILGAVALVYAGVEVGLVRLPIPTRTWQLPREWLRLGYYRSALLYGAGMGLGFLTRTPFSTYHVMVVWQFLAGQIPYGALLGAVYGTGRLTSLFVAEKVGEKLSCSVVVVMQSLFAKAGYVHVLNSAVLGIFGSAAITVFLGTYR